MPKYKSRTASQHMHRKKTGLKTALKIVSIVLVFGIALGAGIGFAMYKDLNTQIKSEDAGKYLKNARKFNTEDPLEGRALNYVLIGSDERGGENGAIGGGTAEDGQRSDTTIIAHVSEDRKRVEMVSIPRDSIVNIPSCKLSNGSSTPAETNAQFNWAYSKGDDPVSGVACTIATIEENTGIYIDGYAIVDFSGFENMVDAVGGIPFNVKEHMVSKKANLDLSKGKHDLNGKEALAFARARTFEVGQGDGSDLQRIQRQQDLLKAFAKKLLSAGTLSNPSKTYKVTESVLQSLTVSPDLGSAGKIAAFGYSLRNISPDNIKFYTVPNTTWSQDTNRVIWTDEANVYWQALNNDTSIQEAIDESKESSSTVPSPSSTGSTTTSDATNTAGSTTTN